MIEIKENRFYLETEHTSYWFHVTDAPYLHLEHVYYGARLPIGSFDTFLEKHTVPLGSSIVLTEPNQDHYSLDALCLEWSGIGRGDYRITPAELRMPDGTFTADFQYLSSRVERGCVAMKSLPTAYAEQNDAETLIVTLQDESNALLLELYYTVFYKTDVITRRVVLKNRATAPCEIRKLLSMSLDIPNRDDTMITFDGGWIQEANRHDRKIQYGIYENSSTTGASSNRHNPGILIAEASAGEDHGNVYGFNLIYSGNHMTCVERSNRDLIRIQTGINPFCFSWTLHPGEEFETPEAVMTFSCGGFNGLSNRFHRFINEHIVRGDWKGKERPVLINNWEGMFFSFNQWKLMRLARSAKKLGVELFVLDDGWFGARSNDSAGLGDYVVNRRKLPAGLAGFAKRINRLGMQFGLWFEPEMVNPDSDLFRSHPEYAVTTPGKKPSFGRHQLVLDLCNPKVRDYIVASVSGILDSANISYVKWDMNRHISDASSPVLKNQGEFYHRYMTGLYDVLTRIFRPRPHILLESCSSGGNRFDLGMLCFSPQIWTSDDTDPIERLKIQGGLSYLYPQSTMGAHVSAAPHQQTLRNTALSTRFNVSAFGCLGYELDLKYLSPIEKREVRAQIAFYKRHRKTLQYGSLRRAKTNGSSKTVFQATLPDGSESIVMLCQTLTAAADANDTLPIGGLSADSIYRISTRPQRIAIRKLGGLVKHVLPIALRPDGVVLRNANRFYALPDGQEQYQCSGAQMMQGIRLQNQFLGTGYHPSIRMLGDFGSTMYLIERKD